MKKQRESQSALERYDKEVNKINASPKRTAFSKSHMGNIFPESNLHSKMDLRSARRSSMESVIGPKGQPFTKFCANMENSKGMTS